MLALIAQIVMVQSLLVAVRFVGLQVLVILLVIKSTQSQFNLKKLKPKCRKMERRETMAYFQAYTNTHAPLEVLKEKFEAALACEGVVGLSIATRPDCLPDDVVEYLAELNERTYFWVELGLQTVHEKTANLINRAHDYQTYVEGVEKLRKHNIRIVYAYY